MFRPRIIPVLLLKNNVLVKSRQFKHHRYIGDPINAVRIFSNLKADELVILDITASVRQTSIPEGLIKQIGEEANMPFAVGGGIRDIKDIGKAIAGGAEKVVIGTMAAKNPEFVREAASIFGSSAICVCIDVKKNLFGKELVYTRCGTKTTRFTPVDFARLMEANGAGELIIQSISNDGMMSGYDIALIKTITTATTIPVTALGGAGNYEHMKDGYKIGQASGLAGGSIFVYQGKKRGVLITYPEHREIDFN